MATKLSAGRRLPARPSGMPKNLLNQAKLLIIDDEPSNVRLLERVVEKFGCPTVRSTTDPREALALFFEFEPDLVLLDLHMPHLDGFAVLEQLKAAVGVDEYLPILVLTADVTVETKRRALTAGAHDLLTKPLDNFEVVLRIKNLLENRFLHRELQRQNLALEEQVQERTAQLEDTLTQLRSAQEHVVKQERLRALGMMAGGIAHDFNNALTMILGYGELLLTSSHGVVSPRDSEYLHYIVAAAQDATHVVSRLREFYRPAGEGEIRVSVDLNALAEQAISLTQPRWKGKCLAQGIQINVEVDTQEIPGILGNAAELREVLTNLIFNAVDAMPDGGTITVSTALRDNGVMLAVCDTGCGMTEEERQRCLEPFFTTKGESGTGLGLAVVYGIVQRHGGTIEITSEKGVGSTFAIILPPNDINVAHGPDAFVEKPDRALRILVVDDQEIISDLLAEHLKCDGHEVATAINATEAVALFQSSAFDLVITDQSMPGMNGEQLARAIAEESASTPIILLTGFGEEISAAGTLAPEIDLVVSKPVTVADLRRAIHQVMAKEGACESAHAQALSAVAA